MLRALGTGPELLGCPVHGRTLLRPSVWSNRPVMHQACENKFLVDPARQRGLLGFGSHLCALLRRTEASTGGGARRFQKCEWSKISVFPVCLEPTGLPRFQELRL